MENCWNCLEENCGLLSDQNVSGTVVHANSSCNTDIKSVVVSNLLMGMTLGQSM